MLIYEDLKSLLTEAAVLESGKGNQDVIMGIIWDLELSEMVKRNSLFPVCAGASGTCASAGVKGNRQNGGGAIKSNNCMQSQGGAGMKQ